MMTDAQKLAKTRGALAQLAGEYEQEGKADIAAKLRTPLPDESIIRLHDILVRAG